MTDNIQISGGLFTHHFIAAIQAERFNHPALAADTFVLPHEDRFSEEELRDQIATAWELLVERWDGLEDEIHTMDTSTLRRRWLLPLFSLLDFELDYQRADLEISGLSFDISHRGRAERDISQYLCPVHLVQPAGREGLESRPEIRRRGPKGLSPHDMVQQYLNMEKEALWGILSDGLRLRVLRDYHHTSTRGYVEFDLQGMLQSRDYAAFRALYRLAHASRFIPPSTSGSTPAGVLREGAGGEGPEGKGESAELPIEKLYQHAQSTGVKVGDELRENVRQAIETLANGFLRATPRLLHKLTNEEGEIVYPQFGALSLEEAFFHDVLTTIYRMLFLLFAEQRGMLPGRGSLYLDEFSMTALRLRAEQALGEDANFDLWERLKATFTMVEEGEEALGIFGYNGALFSPQRTQLLIRGEGQVNCRNDALLQAVRFLTTVEREKVLQRVSYADLSVEEIGSIYESLLDYVPRLSHTGVEVDGREIPPDTFFLDPRGSERKTTGSYYTHPSLVNELIKSALLPVLEDKIRSVVPAFSLDHPEALSAGERDLGGEALLSLNVVDPAAGSGAFLIAATNTLALHLARLRDGSLYPSDHTVRHARRDVLTNCIYGVDLNPMAVELCKVSLWINAAVEDEPLNFLDHHIQCGNSLVGAMPELLKDGVPYKAFAFGKTGDDREVAINIRKRNRMERKQFEKSTAHQPNLFQVTAFMKTQDDLKYWAEINALAATHPHAARERYASYQADEDVAQRKLIADCWTATFFWPLTKDAPQPPTFNTFRQVQQRGREALSEAQQRIIAALAEKHHFFHWNLVFTDVFSPQTSKDSGGFDVVLGNPPWERIKLQEKEFFADKASEIAESGTASKRRKKIKKLPETNPSLWEQYQNALRYSECLSEFLRESGRFPLSAVGDINTYQVFAGLARQVVDGRGRAGIIVPTGIATDYYNQDYFSAIIENRELVSLYDFENRKRLFPEVAPPMKFSLLTLSGEKAPVIEPEFAFFLQQVDQLQNKNRRFALSAEDIARINPNTKTCPVFRTRRDAELTRKLYRAAPVLINEERDKNPWEISFLRMFDMANDSHLFRTREEMEAKGFELQGNIFVRGEDVWLPLYEAKIFHQFEHRYNTFAGTTEKGRTRVKAFAPEVKDVQHKDASFFTLPRYWVDVENITARLKNNSWNRNWLLAFRDIVNVSTNRRTSIFSFVPDVGMGHTAAFILPDVSSSLNLSLGANFNSYPFDWITRQKIGGSHLSFYIVKQLPILPPEIYADTLLKYIVPRVFELTYTAWDLKAFADDVWEDAGNQGSGKQESGNQVSGKQGAGEQGLREAIEKQWQENAGATGGGHAGAEPPEWLKYLGPHPLASSPKSGEGEFPHPPFMWDEERRFRLRAELDALYAHLYGLHRDELAYILDTFPIVKRKDEAKYGEYHTKRVILEIFDELQDSDFDFPDKGQSVLDEGYKVSEGFEGYEVSEGSEGYEVSEGSEVYAVAEESGKQENRESGDQGSKVAEESEVYEVEGAEEPEGAEEEVQLSPAHGFEFYLAVQKQLGGGVSISDVYGAAAANPGVKTVEGLVRVMREEDE